MDINFIGLIGSIIRLIIVFKFNFKKQQEAFEQKLEKEEAKDIVAGGITIIIFVSWGVLTYAIH
jgi:heme/copper-type cytochrome/quinol oxidase subunit 2